MFYDFAIVVPAGRTFANLVKQTLKLTYGIITKVEVEFPAGCRGYVFLTLDWEGHQLYPTNPGGAFNAEGYVIPIEDRFPLLFQPYSLYAKGWAPETNYDHTLTVRIEILEPDVLYPEAKLPASLEKVITFLGGVPTPPPEEVPPAPPAPPAPPPAPPALPPVPPAPPPTPPPAPPEIPTEEVITMEGEHLETFGKTAEELEAEHKETVAITVSSIPSGAAAGTALTGIPKTDIEAQLKALQSVYGEDIAAAYNAYEGQTKPSTTGLWGADYKAAWVERLKIQTAEYAESNPTLATATALHLAQLASGQTADTVMQIMTNLKREAKENPASAAAAVVAQTAAAKTEAATKEIAKKTTLKKYRVGYTLWVKGRKYRWDGSKWVYVPPKS